MIRYTVIPSRAWRHKDTGQFASLYGAVPWTSSIDERNWETVTRGWTVRNERTGTVGIGRVPWKTEAEAQEWADRENARQQIGFRGPAAHLVDTEH